MMARAASAPPAGDSAAAAAAMPFATVGITSFTPMTPVDATSTASGAQPSFAAVFCAISMACDRPSLPVQALAQPLLTTTADACPPDLRR